MNEIIHQYPSFLCRYQYLMYMYIVYSVADPVFKIRIQVTQKRQDPKSDPGST